MLRQFPINPVHPRTEKYFILNKRIMKTNDAYEYYGDDSAVHIVKCNKQRNQLKYLEIMTMYQPIPTTPM